MAADDMKGRYMDTPLYMNVRDAAAYVGIGEKALRDYVNSTDPPPYLMNGQKKMLQVAALADYFEQRQEVKRAKK